MRTKTIIVAVTGIIIWLFIVLASKCGEVQAQELKSVVMKYSSTMDLSVKTRNFINSVDTVTTEIDTLWRTFDYSNQRSKEIMLERIKEWNGEVIEIDSHVIEYIVIKNKIDAVYKTLACQCQPLIVKPIERIYGHWATDSLDVSPDGTLYVKPHRTIGEAILFYTEEKK